MQRVFSEAGNISTEKCSRLTAHKADIKYPVLHHNLPKPNFDYQQARLKLILIVYIRCIVNNKTAFTTSLLIIL
jgi:hypothetical protein